MSKRRRAQSMDVLCSADSVEESGDRYAQTAFGCPAFDREDIQNEKHIRKRLACALLARPPPSWVVILVVLAVMAAILAAIFIVQPHLHPGSQFLATAPGSALRHEATADSQQGWKPPHI